jgi:Domain of unknown function (DUF1911)/Domain of unknown function (DUF1910)
MAFHQARRQRFLNEGHAREFADELRLRIRGSREELETDTLIERARQSFAWAAASDSLELLILRYTSGAAIEELASELPAVIGGFDAYVPLDNPPPNVAHTFTITQQEAYVYVMWLLCLCRMLGHGDLLRTVLGWLDRETEFNRGRDGLFESVVERLVGTKTPVERVLLFPDVYRQLAKATVTDDAAERASLVKGFLDNWYKNMKPCYWYGTHSDKEGSSYFGYWSFEAALVTFLWDVDDSSYRDHLVYPKDLVAFARERFPYQRPVSGGMVRQDRCLEGQPCPREGFWFAPARVGSRRRFGAGEPMPSLGGDYGVTIWQWDEQQ